MNRHLFLLLLCWLLGRLPLLAQDLPLQAPLELACSQTTSLVFPYPIKSVDRGSGDILAQVPEAVANVLQVKAARPGFPETNLTVITADGQLYAFPVRYNARPARMLWRLEAVQATTVLFTDAALNQKQLARISGQLTEDSRFLYGIRARAGGATATVEGLYARGTTLFYRVVLSNASPVPYELDFPRFTLRSRKQAKRTATQEEELPMLHAAGLENLTLPPGQRRVLVFALEKHPLSSDKELVLALLEKNGGRHLQLRLRPRHILQACLLRFAGESGR